MSNQGSPVDDGVFEVDPASFKQPEFRWDGEFNPGRQEAVTLSGGPHLAKKTGARMVLVTLGLMPTTEGAVGRRVEAYIEPFGQTWRDFLLAVLPNCVDPTKKIKFKASDIGGKWCYVTVSSKPDPATGVIRPRIDKWEPYTQAPVALQAPPQHSAPAPSNAIGVPDDDIPF